MTIVENIILITFGSFLALVFSIFLIFIKDWLDERKNRKIAMRKLRLEIKTNEINLRRFPSLKFELLDITLLQLLSSGDINILKKDLRDEIIMYSGEISLFNQTVLRSEGVSTSVKEDLERKMISILVILNNELGKDS